MQTLAKQFPGRRLYGHGLHFRRHGQERDLPARSLAHAPTEMARSGERPISMEELVERDPRNRERIFPYIGGKEVNDEPDAQTSSLCH